MTSYIKVNIGDNVHELSKNCSLEELSNQHKDKVSHTIIAAKVDNEIQPLSYTLPNDCTVTFIDRSSEDGMRIYVRSLTMLLIRACKELFPDFDVKIGHSLNKGLYCEFLNGNFLTPRLVNKIEARMKEIVLLAEPFERMEINVDQAKEELAKMTYYDKAELLNYRLEKTIPLYRFGWTTDCHYGIMLPNASYLDCFDLKYYLPGLILRFPQKDNPDSLPDYLDNPKLFNVFSQTENWAKLINVTTVVDLNKKIELGTSNELIHISEALHEKQISQIADRIYELRQHLHLILIAGPSSSGKTTFAQRLKIHLMVNGLNPIPISMDNYYLDRKSIPVDENGERDLEALSTIDVELLNEHLSRLIQGERVEMPRFNFKKGIREFRGDYVSIDNKQPIIIEGIHGLNEQLTPMIPRINKYKIYISALTQLNIDRHNHIPTTDTRLIRRIVRDNKFRGASIGDTLTMWASVRRGEERNIFPFQELADVMFNSALTYELAVLKPYILPLLESIKKDNPHFTEANRLLKFMKYFKEMDGAHIPATSILKEFIGGSCLDISH